MTPDPPPVDWSQAKSIFNELVDLPAAQQLQRLDDLPAEHQQLRATVERLLRAQQDTDFLVDPEPTPAPPTVDAGQNPLPPQIGPYTPVERIGEGGFGVVYRATQTSPVEREVAIKLIKPGHDSPQLMARFIDERRFLATIDHPDIVKVLDAGTTEDGRSFVVMELVRGAPITEYARGRDCSLDQRIKLMIDAARAVHHVHQRAIIHRDLKPNNILVSEDEGTPRIRIIDFGIATAVAEEDRSGWTQVAGPIGTPKYASPEQINPEGHVDTRADVFALGMVLCELLTGELPRDASTETRTSIRRPSSLVGETNPSFGARLLRGDLDRIIMKCVADEPEMRYDSAAALADDLERYRNGAPVLATTPSTAYLVRKFVGRHRVAATFATLAVVALIVGYAIALDGRQDAIEQRIIADDAREEASRNAARAERVSTFLLRDMVAATDPTANTALGRDTTILELLEATRLATEGDSNADAGFLFDILGRVGIAYMQLHEFSEAVESIQRALNIAPTLDPVPIDRCIELELALIASEERIQRSRNLFVDRRVEVCERALAELGPLHPMTLRARLARAETEPASQNKVEEIQTLIAAASHEPAFIIDLHEELAITFRQLSQTDDEIKAREALLAHTEAMYPPGRTARMSSRYQLARSLFNVQRYQDAIDVLGPVVNASEDPVPRAHPGRVSSALLVVKMHALLEQHDASLELARATNDAVQSADRTSRWERLATQTAYAEALFGKELWAEALAELQSNDVERQALMGSNDNYRTIILAKMAEAHRQLGELHDAEVLCRKALAIAAPTSESIAIAAETLVRILIATDRTEEARGLATDVASRAAESNVLPEILARIHALEDLISSAESSENR